ncbi:hypothetical protein D3C87_1356000 [compost metagenome]
MVRIEMDQGKRTILGRVSLQQRIADEVIAAQGQHRSTRRQDPLGMGPDRRWGLLRGAVIEIAIAIIDTSQQIERVKFPRPVTRPGRLDRCLADGPRSEAAARSIAGRSIERNAANGDIHATQIAGVATPHKTSDTTVGRFTLGAIQAVTRHRLIDY